MINIILEVTQSLKDLASELTKQYLNYVNKTRSMWVLLPATRMYDDESRASSPALYGSIFSCRRVGNGLLAAEPRRYLARSKFKGDLCYIRNLAALPEKTNFA